MKTKVLASAFISSLQNQFYENKINSILQSEVKNLLFLVSQDAKEVILVTDLLTYWVSVSTDLTDVTLVSDDT